MDVRAVVAQQAHRDSEEHARLAAAARNSRDRQVRALREEDPRHWTYGRLATAVGCSPELIAVICRKAG